MPNPNRIGMSFQNFCSNAQHLFSESPWPGDVESKLSGTLKAVPLSTTEPGDLFPLIEKACQRSEFVALINKQSPQELARAVVNQLKSDDRTYCNYLLSQISANVLDIELTEKSLEFSQQSEQQIMTELRRFRKIESASLAVLNLTNWIALPQAALRMSLLAERIVNLAYYWSYSTVAERHGGPCSAVTGAADNLLILAMGKLGGYDLNFSSDIDLIFFYPDKGETQRLPFQSEEQRIRTVENARFWQRVAAQMITLVEQVNGEGFCFRTDMRLRPYGDSGPLVMSLAEAEDYYQEQGRDWERFAMIRARVVSGREDEQQRLNQIIKPFSFRRYIDYGVLESIRSMKAMIEREVRARGLKNNIKLGAGGIREIEFIVQSMQLIQGGRDPRLQEQNILKVLPLLVESRLLPKNAGQELADAWCWLRKLEDVIQAYAEKQTQELPDDAQRLKIIADVFGCSDSQFSAKVDAVTARVRWHFSQLLSEKNRKPQQAEWAHSLWQSDILPEKNELQINQLNQQQWDEIVALLQQFKSDRRLLNLSDKGRRRLNAFMPALLSLWLKASTSAERARETLRRLLTIIHAVLKRTAYLELLSENPPLLEQLVNLVDISEWICIRLANYPILLDELLYPSRLYQPLSQQALEDELRQMLLRSDGDEENIMDSLRQFKQINELRIAAAFVTQKLKIEQVSDYLSALATVIISQVLSQSWRAMVTRYGQPESLVPDESNMAFAILGYGKLGGGELGFGSDLDLVFIFDVDAQEKTNGKKSVEASRFYTRLGQKVIHYLSTKTHLGDLYEVDMRLRPSGNSGLLVSSFDAFQHYQQAEAWTWEHQALVRARVLVGDEQLADKIEALRHHILTSKKDKQKIRVDVVSMREKMRKELLVKNKIDLKQMAGGIVDIEFIAQFMALTCQSKVEIATNTVKILQLFTEQFSVQYDLSKEDVERMIESYRCLIDAVNLKLLTSDNNIEEQVMEEKADGIIFIWNKIFGENQ